MTCAVTCAAIKVKACARWFPAGPPGQRGLNFGCGAAVFAVAPVGDTVLTPSTLEEEDAGLAAVTVFGTGTDLDRFEAALGAIDELFLENWLAAAAAAIEAAVLVASAETVAGIGTVAF